MKGFGAAIFALAAALLGSKNIGGDTLPPSVSPPDGTIPFNPDDPGREGVIDSWIPDQPGYTDLHDRIPMFQETLDPGIVAESFGGSDVNTSFTAIPLVISDGTSVLEPAAAPAPVKPEEPRWSWYTPGGTIISRDPTEEEKESGLGCPEIPGIWTYPGESMQDLHYDEAGHILEDQGVDSPPGKRWFCRVEWTYKG